MPLSEAKGRVIKMINNKSSAILNKCRFAFIAVLILALISVAAAGILSCSKKPLPEEQEKDKISHQETGQLQKTKVIMKKQACL